MSKFRCSQLPEEHNAPETNKKNRKKSQDPAALLTPPSTPQQQHPQLLHGSFVAVSATTGLEMHVQNKPSGPPELEYEL